MLNKLYKNLRVVDLIRVMYYYTIMKTYRVRYNIIFAFDNEALEVKGEMSVEDGTEYYDGIVKNDDTASIYIQSLFNDNENNLVDIPPKVMDKKFSTDLYITNIISIQK